jgi:hypothetical protein
MNEGIFLKTFPLTGYPTDSQELMQKIVVDFKDKGIKVKPYKGSYSIIRIFDTETAVKILCTIESSFETRDKGVLVLYRKELLESIGMDKIRIEHPTLDLKEQLLTVGGGTFRDFYYTEVDNLEMYLVKKEDILAFATKIISIKGPI